MELGSWGVLSPDEGEEPYVLSSLVGLGGSSLAFAVRDMLSRGRAKNIGTERTPGQGGIPGPGGAAFGGTHGRVTKKQRWQ